MKTKTESTIISRVLSPALKLWLRSQVDQVEELEVKITGGDRQILGGYIPRVFLATSHAVYQGLHLGEVELTGENIRINLGQILKGKPLRLLEAVVITGKVMLKEADLFASVQSPLLSIALTDLLLTLLEAKGINNSGDILQDYQVGWQEVEIQREKLILRGTLTDEDGQKSPVIIRSGLELASPQKLRLHPLQIEGLKDFLRVSLSDFQVDLGSEVALEQLNLEAGQLYCCGSLTVLPEVEQKVTG
ncbi:MAG: DUF2993 domain-containing protein [Moorea sp. SIO2B7]|nr:DUF2993 domain-containing protein [Moorena sp. SIO2B7]